MPLEKRPFEDGFSLLETLMAIAIVAILLALGVPSFKYVTQSNRSTSEINSLLGSLQLARAEAIKEGQRVSVCPSVDLVTCSGSTSWQSGWLIFSDGGAVGVIDGTDFVVRVQTGFTTADTLQTDHAVSVITFSREGFAMNLPNAVTFTLHNPVPVVPQYTRCLSLTIVGALSTQIAGANTAELLPCN